MTNIYLRKYNTAATVGGVVLITRGAGDFKANPTLATGDVKLSKDGGAFANLGTLPAATPASGVQVELVLTNTELSCARAIITFIDQTSPKEWEDQIVYIETYGHASGQFQMDLNDAVRLGLTGLANATPGAAGGLFIAGTNAATTITTALTTTLTGNLTGSVASVTGAVGSVTGNVGGNVTGSVGSVVGAVGSVTGAVGSVTGLTAADVNAIKLQTDKLTFTVANQIDANIESVNAVTVNGNGAGTPWGP